MLQPNVTFLMSPGILEGVPIRRSEYALRQKYTTS